MLNMAANSSDGSSVNSLLSNASSSRLVRTFKASSSLDGRLFFRNDNTVSDFGSAAMESAGSCDITLLSSLSDVKASGGNTVSSWNSE